MILTEEQAKARLNSEGNLINKFRKEEVERKSSVIEITPLNRTGRIEDKGNVPIETRTEIAARARLGETDRALGKEYGISHTTVSNYQIGSWGQKLDENAIQDRMNEIQDVAMCKLLKSLGFLDDSKLSKMNGKDLSAVAANMAKVAGAVRPQGTDANQVHLHLYAPELRKEQNYTTIEVHSV